jgi:hypothetical protein
MNKIILAIIWTCVSLVILVYMQIYRRQKSRRETAGMVDQNHPRLCTLGRNNTDIPISAAIVENFSLCNNMW